jgi:hypothetical protein
VAITIEVFKVRYFYRSAYSEYSLIFIIFPLPSQYLFNQNISAVGNWEGKEAENIKSNEKESQSVFGLDLEFKKEFR